jgi:hypothetical protein
MIIYAQSQWFCPIVNYHDFVLAVQLILELLEYWIRRHTPLPSVVSTQHTYNMFLKVIAVSIPRPPRYPSLHGTRAVSQLPLQEQPGRCDWVRIKKNN